MVEILVIDGFTFLAEVPFLNLLITHAHYHWQTSPARWTDGSDVCQDRWHPMNGMHIVYDRGKCDDLTPTCTLCAHRESPLYRAVYTQRTACERINSQDQTLGIERPKVRIAQKVVKYVPVDKLYDAFISLLAGTHGLLATHLPHLRLISRLRNAHVCER